MGSVAPGPSGVCVRGGGLVGGGEGCRSGYLNSNDQSLRDNHRGDGRAFQTSWESNGASRLADYGGNGWGVGVGVGGNFQEPVEVHESALAGTSKDSRMCRESSTHPSEEVMFA